MLAFLPRKTPFLTYLLSRKSTHPAYWKPSLVLQSEKALFILGMFNSLPTPYMQAVVHKMAQGLKASISCFIGIGFAFADFGI
ncbi:hypothetical protein ACFL5V_05970, partial [Fibrobacterota bacterium]